MDTEIFVGSVVKPSLEVAEIKEDEKGIHYVLKVPGDTLYLNRITVESGCCHANIPD